MSVRVVGATLLWCMMSSEFSAPALPVGSRCFYHDSAEDIAVATADAVEKAAMEAIAMRGIFHLALAGGTTPRRCYEYLRDKDIDWSSTHIWFGDERCLAVGDMERNDTMADEALLKHVSIPASQVHRIAAHLGPEKGAELYAEALSAISCLDLVLLGMGEDGHTASLFPENPALDDTRLVVPVFSSPKPPSERVSLGYTALRAARKRIVMVAGEGKRDVFQRILYGESLPVVFAPSTWMTTIFI